MGRKLDDADKLIIWFYNEVLSRKADCTEWRKDKAIIHKFSNPPNKHMQAYTTREIQQCILALQHLGVNVTSLGILNCNGMLRTFTEDRKQFERYVRKYLLKQPEQTGVPEWF